MGAYWKLMGDVLNNAQLLGKSEMRRSTFSPEIRIPFLNEKKEAQKTSVPKKKDSHTGKKKKDKKKGKKETQETVQPQPEAVQQPEPEQCRTPGQSAGLDLRQAILWSEILGDPISVKRKKRRMEHLYGNQGYDRRR